jgi:hypothetical protein
MSLEVTAYHNRAAKDEMSCGASDGKIHDVLSQANNSVK